MSIYTPTTTVSAIGQINISGNVIPATWWGHIRLPSGKPDSTAIVLLSEIVYWYRPAEVRDEYSGELKGLRKRFHGDKLQRSYQAFADQFGFSKRETTDALKRLREAGIITLELRTINTNSGAVNNVLYVEPVADKVAYVTNTIAGDLVEVQPENDATFGTGPTLKRNRGYVETEQGLRQDGTGPTLKRKTNTEITTEITTEIKKPIGAFADAPAPTRSAKQDYSPEFETAWQAYPKRAGGNPKPSAYKAWNARLKDGATPEAMLAGVKRYAAFVAATGKLGSEYVKQAATFFGPDRHFDETWQTPSAPGGVRHTLPPVSGFEGQNYGESGCNW